MHGAVWQSGFCNSQGSDDVSGYGSTSSASTEFLDSEATTIILRRLPSHLTIEMLAELLNHATPGKYDFVYLPYGKRKERNVALAFINFTSHAAALRATAYLSADGSIGPEGRAPLQVSQARVQGLGPNLAYFVARFGFQDLKDPYAPRVYDTGGNVLDIMAVLCRHVNMSMLTEAQAHLQDEREISLQRREGAAALVEERRRTKVADQKQGAAAPRNAAGRASKQRKLQLRQQPEQHQAARSYLAQLGGGDPYDEETEILLQKVRSMERSHGYVVFEL